MMKSASEVAATKRTVRALNHLKQVGNARATRSPRPEMTRRAHDLNLLCANSLAGSFQVGEDEARAQQQAQEFFVQKVQGDDDLLSVDRRVHAAGLALHRPAAPAQPQEKEAQQQTTKTDQQPQATPERKDKEGSTPGIFALARMPEESLLFFPLPNSSAVLEAEEKTRQPEKQHQAQQTKKAEDTTLTTSSPSIFALASMPEGSQLFFLEAEEKARAQEASGLTEAGFFLQKTSLGAMRKHYSGPKEPSAQAVDQAEEGQQERRGLPDLWAVASGGEEQLQAYFLANSTAVCEAQQKAEMLTEAGFFLQKTSLDTMREHYDARRVPWQQADEGTAQEDVGSFSSGNRSYSPIQTAIMWAALDENAGGSLSTATIKELEALVADSVLNGDKTIQSRLQELAAGGVRPLKDLDRLTLDYFLNVKKNRPLTSIAVPTVAPRLAAPPAFEQEEKEGGQIVFESALPEDTVAEEEPRSAAQQLGVDPAVAAMLLHFRHVQGSPGQQQNPGAMQAQPLEGRPPASSRVKGELRDDLLRGLNLLRGASGGLGPKQLHAMRERYTELAQRRGEAKESFGLEPQRRRSRI